MVEFNWPSALIGFLVGLAVMLILVWILYLTRSFMFTYCPLDIQKCSGSAYYSNPGAALAAGAQISQILSINSNNELFYKRVPKTNNCAPGPDQTVYIAHPQYCQFTYGGQNYIGKNQGYDTNRYDVALGANSMSITTNNNCAPVNTPGFTAGKPMLYWDSIPPRTPQHPNNHNNLNPANPLNPPK